jgi:hypothetical protein
MTSRHELITQVEGLQAEVERQRQGRLDVSMKNYELLEQIEDLKAIVDRTADLKGPDYACVCQSNNGQVWAYTRAQVREDWIRRFAGHALTSGEVGPVVAARLGFETWVELERRFEMERAEAAPEPEPEGD